MDERMKRRAALYMLIKYVDENNGSISINTDKVKKVFNEHIEKLRTDPVLRKLYRWELSSNNELITAMRAEREKVGMDLIRQVCELTGRPQQEVAALAAIITSSVAYLAMLADTCSVYNGIYVDSDEGWNQILREIQNLVDKLFES